MSGRLVASFFGAGYAPLAPGTVGSAVAVVLGAGLLHVSVWALALASALAVAAGFAAIPSALASTDVDSDPGWVVIDEVAGQLIAMLGLAAVTLPGVLAAFGLFRLLDICKPGPVGWADRQQGAFGIMADDLLAGAIAAVLLYGLRWTGMLA